MTASNLSPRQEFIEAAKAAFFKLAVRKVMAKIALKLGAWAVTGPMGFITEWIVEKIMTAALDGADMLIFFQFIDFRVGNQEDKAVQAYLDYYRTTQNGTKEQIIEAEFKLVKAHDEFVHLNSY
jgi:hypothetical protein